VLVSQSIIATNSEAYRYFFRSAIKMKTPLPGATVRGSQSGVAIMALFDLLGRKWNMRILWELRAKPLSFRALQQQCDAMSPSVLNTRLKQLAEARLLCPGTQGYELSRLGQALTERLDPLRDWTSEWVIELGTEPGNETDE
jgi:DNA-binding HxlR family transcriptional regulator